MNFRIWMIAVLSMAGGTPAGSQTPKTESAIQTRGTLSFTLQTKRAFRNGMGVRRAQFPFLKIPGLGEASLQENSSSVGIFWRWKDARGAPQYRPLISELPGPESYFFQLTWDAEKGLFDFYINGFPMRSPGIASRSWEFQKAAGDWQAAEGPLAVTELKIQPRYLPPGEARKQVPEKFFGRHADVFGQVSGRKPLDTEKRRGRKLLDAPLKSPDEVKRWILEGPGDVSIRDGWMEMRSTRPDAVSPENGHIVFWCPRDFPDRFLAEWEIQPVSEEGLTIFFFAARGEKGEDIFDPGLPKRDGTFSHYTRGAIRSYHISYYANTPGYPGRMTSNLRKNNRFYLLASGPVAIPAGSKKVHRMRLIKDRNHIQFQADGKVIIDYTDTGESRYGPILGSGKIGFRQMQWMVARYRNFRVWELLP